MYQAYLTLFELLLLFYFSNLPGVTHALVWAASTSFIGSATSQKNRSSAQGILQGVYHGLGRGSGTIFGGMIISAYGKCCCVIGQLEAINCLMRGTVPPGQVVRARDMPRRPIGCRDCQRHARRKSRNVCVGALQCLRSKRQSRDVYKCMKCKGQAMFGAKTKSNSKLFNKR